MMYLFPALNRCASFMREGQAQISTASSHILIYFFTVLNSERFKVGWDFLPSAINATLSLEYCEC